MSSKFSVVNFSKDQKTLNSAASALWNYVIIGTLWSLGTALSLYSIYGGLGAAIGLLFNIIMMGWIVLSYMTTFEEAAKKYNLQEPLKISKTVVWGIIIVLILILIYYTVTVSPNKMTSLSGLHEGLYDISLV